MKLTPLGLALNLGAWALRLCAVDTGPVLFMECTRPLAVAPDGKSVVFPERLSPLMLSRLGPGGWGEPQRMRFLWRVECGDPCFSADGRQLFFWSRRPGESPDIWVSEATASGWGEPRCLGLAVGGKRGGNVHPVVTARGDVHFTGRHGTLGRRDLFVARRTPDGYGEPENLGAPVNSPEDEFDGFVTPDESTLLFCRSRKDGSDLYVTFRREGAWAIPRKLGANVNFGFGPICPSLSRDGRWLFFTTYGGGGRTPGIYRIDAAVLKGDPSSLSLEAEPFAPGRISRPGAFGLTFLPDGQTACFAELHDVLMESRLEGGSWTAPEPLPATALGMNQAPSFSPDGQRLLFVSNQPEQGQPARSAVDWAVWTLGRVPGGWGTPRRLGNLLDEAKACFVDTPTLTRDGRLFFTGMSGHASPNSKLYQAQRDGMPARELPPPLNVEGSDQAHVAVSPDGRTLVFSSDRPGGFGRYDLYVCRAKPGGGWTDPRNLGQGVNSTGNDTHPALSGDGRFLYFFSDRNGRTGTYRVALPEG